VYCEICKSKFDISNSGPNNIKNHVKKHQVALNTTPSIQKVNNFFKNYDFATKNLQLAAKEGTFACHTIKHKQNFRSLDCTSKLVAILFESKFA
jgi:hypothetical protein